MEVWIIAASAAGGCIVLALLVLAIYKCCQRQKRKNNKRNATGQNGQVWQAHGKDVELGDEGMLQEDGLCQETNAGSTFPRRVKAEDTNPTPKRQDGLCEDTQKRFTYPRRIKAENELLLPMDKNNTSASETALKSAVPLGFSVIAGFGSNEERIEKADERSKSNSTTGVQVHSFNQNTPKKHVKDEEISSDSSSNSGDIADGKGSRQLISSVKKGRKAKRHRSFVERERAKSLSLSLEGIPEYSKPMKRSASNPSIVAREKMFGKDKRFESLETWRSSVPLPETDYPNPMSNTRSTDDDEQDNAPPSYATSDSGVECLDALSGNDDESLNHCDSVPESPGIPSLPINSFSSYKDHTSYRESTEIRYQGSEDIRNTTSYGFQGNSVSMKTMDHTALIDANVDESTANRQDIFFPSALVKSEGRNIDLPDNDTKRALTNTRDSKWTSPTSNSLSNSKSTTQRIQTTEQQMDFRSVKLRPTSKSYEDNDSTFVFSPNKENTALSPSYEVGVYPKSPVQQKQPNTPTEMVTSQSSITDRIKEHYLSDVYQKEPVSTEKTVAQRNSQETEQDLRTDFHRVKLRHTPQSLKQHIGFREEMEPYFSTEVHKEENSTSNKPEEERETTIGVLDGIKKFQTRGSEVPKPLYGSHYISKKDSNPRPVNIDSQVPVANSKPVNIVSPKPAATETHNTPSKSINPSKEVNIIQKENASSTFTKKETRRPVSMIELGTSEDKRHFRFSTGNVNQIHVNQGFNASQKTVVVTRDQEEEENTNAPTNKQDSLEKPVAVVPPQSPKTRRETSEERAAIEEERKKNWKREQIEQKLTTAHVRSQKEQFIQASGLAYRSCMPELFSKIKQIGEEKDEVPAEQ